MEKSKTALMAIPTIKFQKCFESWIKRWHKCVADGEYFEGDNIIFDETCILNFLSEFRELFDQGSIYIYIYIYIYIL